MSDTRWNLLNWALMLATWLAWPWIEASRSVDGRLACMIVNAFVMGVVFRGIVGGPRRREKPTVDPLEDV